MVPSCATAGELKMMSPVAYDHRSVPSRATAYTRLSCEPTTTEPSPAMAGDETMGPEVVRTHQMLGFTAGSVNGERPRWAGPKRNIAWAGSIAYCGSGSGAAPGSGPTPGACDAEAGQTQWPASHSRFNLQSWSLEQGTASTWAHPSGPRQSARPRDRPASQSGRDRAGGNLTGGKRNDRMPQG